MGAIVLNGISVEIAETIAGGSIFSYAANIAVYAGTSMVLNGTALVCSQGVSTQF